ncbi:acyltransferase family protein [Vibrio cortegadensis]|uniref:acyltransferase family protein n=1 Tax=Vibrio cortegadensis TaxID=1328770 RepID=UPI00352DDF1D
MIASGYRDDISGLRALAVVIVILFHTGFTSVSGGYVGVDVFFVLSGFLITSILYKDLVAGEFSYKKFYLRRVRRLIPVLLVVLAFTLTTCWFFLLPEDFYRTVNGAGTAFLSVSNFYFSNITSGYWGARSQLVPLIHTWSLSVEEQFYIIWPTLLLLLFKVFKKQRLSSFVLLLVVVFLGLSEYLARYSPNSAYYLLPARSYELLMGAWLALTLHRIPVINAKLNHLLSIIALVSIVAMAFVLREGSVFPGINAAVVCLATVILLITGKDKDNQGIINKLMSNKVVAYIGLISYSLYLWHWPINVFCNYLSIEKTLPIKAAILTLTFVMSVLSYHFVEQAFRFKYVFSPRKTFALFLGVPFALLLSTVLITKEHDGFPERFSGEGNDRLSVFISTNYNDCTAAYCGPEYKNKFSTDYIESDFLLVGDSHAQSMEGFFNSLANDAEKQGTLVYNGGTPFLVDVERYDTKRKGFTSYSAKNKQTQEMIENFKGDTVVLTARYSKYVDELYDSWFMREGDTPSYEQSLENFKSSMMSTIDYILSQDKRLIIVEDVPYFPVDKSKCEILKSRFEGSTLCSSSEDRAVIENFQQFETEFFAKVKPLYPQVLFINTRELLCDSQQCYVAKEGLTYYKDNGHLNYVGSKQLGQQLLQVEVNPLL